MVPANKRHIRIFKNQGGEEEWVRIALHWHIALVSYIIKMTDLESVFSLVQPLLQLLE